MKNLLIGLIVVSTAVNLYVSYQLFTLKKNASILLRQKDDTIAELTQTDQMHFASFKETLRWQFKCEDLAYNDDANFVSVDGKELKLSSLTGRPKLIHRVTTKSCEVCWSPITATLKNAGEMIGAENVIVIVPVSELRRTLDAFREQEISVTLLATDSPAALNLPVEDHSAPFFFVADKGMVKHLFVPLKDDVESTQDNLSLMKDKYF